MSDEEMEPDDAPAVSAAADEPVVTTTKRHNRQAERFHASRKGGGTKFLLLGLLLVVVGICACIGAGYGIDAETSKGLYNAVMGLGAIVAALGVVGGLVGLAKNG